MADNKRIQVDLTGQVAIVTGASRGLGKAIALRLGECGAKVACLARDQAKLAETVAAITAAGGQATAFAVDVTQSASVTEVVDQIATDWQRVDILVNNAGITRDTLLLAMKDEQWDDVLNTNLRGPFLFTRAVLRTMMGQRYGRIINISSVSGLMGNPGQANYSATKAGLIGFTATVAKEMAKRNITVNAVAPGFIESEMTAALGPALADEVKKRVPVQRLGRAEEVADTVLFLAAPGSGYITGICLTIDGGLTA
ncbi:MAG: 3-oxoacyl-[acyl-carrier-protein] reductase [Pirellulales bacterium]|nr:3-oxoacyl-[acyl-carrier-protein] reductase [Pirellulales bacterium]